MIRSLTLTSLFLLFSGTISAAQPILIQESDSTTDARLVEPSANRPIHSGEKINRLTTLNLTRPYVLQRLTPRAYWFQRQFYGVTFYVGKQGVLLFDAPPGRGEHILKAIGEVT